jgi:hypothetical protein
MKKYFFNINDEIRPGWKILVFLIFLFSFYFLLSNLIIIFNRTIYSGYIVVLLSIICSTFLSTKLLDKKTFLSIGLYIKHGTKRELLSGAFLSLIMISTIFLFELFFGFIKISIKSLNFQSILDISFQGLLLYLIIAFNEELLFRGYMFQKLMEGTNKIVSIIFLSIIFSGLHLFNPEINVIAIINIMIASIWFSLAFITTLSLWMPISMHFIWNYFEGVIYSFPVSGIVNNPSFFYLDQFGPDWLTGGNFGPEGGIITTFVLAGGCTYFLFNKNLWINK